MRTGKEYKNILAIESAVAGGSIALITERGDIVRSEGQDSSRAERILGIILEVVTGAQITLRDVELIAVSTGPGSYSGIRIGLSTALGLRDALEVPSVGVSVLEAMASFAPGEGSLIAAVPVGKNDVAWQLFGAGKEVERTSAFPPELTTYPGFAEKLPDFPFTLFAHTDVLTNLAPSLTQGLNCVDAGIELAEFVGQFAASVDYLSDSLRPIYLRSREGEARQPTIS